MDDEQKAKRIKLMRYWLFGTFVIVFAAITTYIGLFTNRNAFLALQIGLPVWGVTGILCVVIFYGYKFLYVRNIKAE